LAEASQQWPNKIIEVDFGTCRKNLKFGDKVAPILFGDKVAPIVNK
jgi:hypothetical protein